MPVPIEALNDYLIGFERPEIQNLFAQAHAKHVLLEVGERPENFPHFDPQLEDKITFIAHALFAGGCSLVEQGQFPEGAVHLERAASLIEYVYGPVSARIDGRSVHILLSGMAFYAAGHYSRAFVAIRNAEEETQAARIIGAFLRKDVPTLIHNTNDVLLAEPPDLDDQQELDDWAITGAIARAVILTVEFFYTGDDELLARADNQLKDALVVATSRGHATWWLILRLARLMLRDVGRASPWNLLPPYIGPNAEGLVSRYIRLLAFGERPITEIWSSQQAALPLALSDDLRGAVINLRTGAGKTRVAELAILKVVSAHPDARIFYLAPFRSLAIEVEHALASIFHPLGFTVSHLYGGSRVSSIDREVTAESTITIATPEKARALLRAVPELFRDLRLLIIDEGHLIGPSARFVRNEIFLDHLRFVARELGAPVLLLSAVLPNAGELAEWIASDPQRVSRSTWRPSSERFGLLRWTGRRARIEWQGKIPSFNPSFVEAQPLGSGRRKRPFPNTKNEAVAASAVRLSSTGPVMIFAGKAISVPTLAKAALTALGESTPRHPWPDQEWKVFEAVCQEEIGTESIEFRAAVAGVVCHSNRLTPQVRLALEHLMRARAPRIIIATTTLGQGVNVGISSVIIASPYISQHPIDRRDSWNICGRAGRAFVDGEGKLLYAIDDTRQRWQIEKDERLAASYFDVLATDPVKSGLLFIVANLKQIADQNGIPFNVLLELSANNDFTPLGNRAGFAKYVCDLVDDELLAMHMDRVINLMSEDPSKWIESAFRESLAVIQARAVDDGVSPQDVIGFLESRAQSAIARTTDDVSRTAIAASGLPLSVAVRAFNDLDVFRAIVDFFTQSDNSLSALSTTVQRIEHWVRENAQSVVSVVRDQAVLDALRELWLGGTGLRLMVDVHEDAERISRDFYGYELPWIVHAASQQLRAVQDADRAEVLDKLALLIELGVPSDLAAQIFLAGVRSRAAATELSRLDIDFGKGIRNVSQNLRDPEFLASLWQVVSPSTSVWLKLMMAETETLGKRIPEIESFNIAGSDTVDRLYVRTLGDRLYLSSVDGRQRFLMHPDPHRPFSQVANDPRIVFIKEDGGWRMHVQDPRVAPGR